MAKAVLFDYLLAVALKLRLMINANLGFSHNISHLIVFSKIRK